eukprot:1766082-Prymnesium_polylepis.1
MARSEYSLSKTMPARTLGSSRVSTTSTASTTLTTLTLLPRLDRLRFSSGASSTTFEGRRFSELRFCRIGICAARRTGKQHDGWPAAAGGSSAGGGAPGRELRRDVSL